MAGYTFKDELKRWREPYSVYGSQNLSTVGDSIIDSNSTISPIDREDANIEAEKEEILQKPDGSLFKILGKSHSQNGTPLLVPKDSFIYSKHKPLAIDKESKDLFEMKEGGKWTKEKNTPAKILQREIDIKHHNKMLTLLDSKNHDEISKNSAKLMLEKNFKKLGQVAYLQEEKKGFPDGLPDFSQGASPEHNESALEAKQYMQSGGKPRFRFTPTNRKFVNDSSVYKNAFEEALSKIKQPPPAGSLVASKYKNAAEFELGQITPSEINRLSQDKYANNKSVLQSLQLKQQAYQDALEQSQGSVQKQTPNYFKNPVYMHTQPNEDSKLVLNEFNQPSNEKRENGQYVNGIWHPLIKSTPKNTNLVLNEFGNPSNEKNDRGHYVEGIWYPKKTNLTFKQNKPQSKIQPIQKPTGIVTPRERSRLMGVPVDQPSAYSNMPVGSLQTIPDSNTTLTNNPTPFEYPDEILPYTPELNKTFNQKLDEGYAALNAINTPKFYPERKQYNFTPLNLQRASERPYLNQIGQQTSSFLQNNRLNAPNMNRASASGIYGKMLDSNNQVMGQVYNQNIQIGNSEEQYNNQGFNNTAEKNVNANAQYVDQVNMTDQNSVVERKEGWNAFTSLRNRNNDIIAKTKMQLASQPTYGSIWINPKTNQRVNTNNLSDEQLYKLGYRKQASPLYKLNPNTWNPEYTGAGNVDLMNQQGRTGSRSTAELRKEMDDLGITDSRARAAYAASVMKQQMNPKFQQLNPYGG